MIVADYRALYKQGSLERIRASAQELYILILNVHEDIRTTLTFREQTCAPINLKRPGPATCHDPRRVPELLRSLHWADEFQRPGNIGHPCARHADIDVHQHRELPAATLQRFNARKRID